MGFSRRLLDRLGFGFGLVRLARIVDQIDSAIDGGGIAFDDRTQDPAIGTREDLACLSRLAIRFDRGVIELVVDGFRVIDVFGFGSFEQVIEAQKEVVRANKLESCYLRPLAWIGSEKLGVSARGNTIHMSVSAWPWGAYLGEEGLAKGIRVKTSSFTRHHVNVSLVRAKASGYYINSILANQEVTANGYDEALLLDTEGYVSEGAGENVFIVRDSVIYTPDLASCLDGITRDSVLTMARDLGYKVVEKRITRDEMYCADEAFFTGTAAEVTPIRELDDRIIGEGSRGPITEKLQSLFFEVVAGKSEKYRNWLTPV